MVCSIPCGNSAAPPMATTILMPVSLAREDDEGRRRRPRRGRDQGPGPGRPRALPPRSARQHGGGRPHVPGGGTMKDVRLEAGQSPAVSSETPRALVVYESMFGNTEKVAAAVARGLQLEGVDTGLVEVRSAPTRLSPDVDLLV